MYVSSPRVPPADFIICAIDRYVRACHTFVSRMTFRRACVRGFSLALGHDRCCTLHRIECAISFINRHTEMGEAKSRSGFRILISRFAVALPSITFVGNVNIVVYVSICMIHCSVTMTCKNKIFILRSCVSDRVSYVAHVYNMLFVL